MSDSRGGAREGAGRKRLESGAQRRHNITISDRLAAKARAIGGGNLSAGIRCALESFCGDPVAAAQAMLRALRDEQRADLFCGYCVHCGRGDPRCQCWNDE